MSNPFDFFDRIYCIHLPNQRERHSQIKKEFESVGINNVQFVHASPPPAKFKMSNMRRNSRGEYGVNLSQIKAVVHAISDGAERPLFFEDDIYFTEGATLNLQSALKELPDNWGVFYMGGHPRGPVPARRAVKVGETVVKIQRYSFADAYSINGNQLRNFYDYWSEHITKDDAMYDFILGEFAGANNGYSMYPIICEQHPGISGVTLQHDNKDSIIARAWASHLGPRSLIPRHKKTFDEWKKKNPGKWEQSLQRMARKR